MNLKGKNLFRQNSMNPYQPNQDSLSPRHAKIQSQELAVRRKSLQHDSTSNQVEPEPKFFSTQGIHNVHADMYKRNIQKLRDNSEVRELIATCGEYTNPAFFEKRSSCHDSMSGRSNFRDEYLNQYRQPNSRGMRSSQDFRKDARSLSP